MADRRVKNSEVQRAGAGGWRNPGLPWAERIGKQFNIRAPGLANHLVFPSRTVYSGVFSGSVHLGAEEFQGVPAAGFRARVVGARRRRRPHMLATPPRKQGGSEDVGVLAGKCPTGKGPS